MKRVLFGILFFSCACVGGGIATNREQKDGLWKYMYSVNIQGQESSFFAKDSDRFTDDASAKYPKLALKITSSNPTPYKEAIAEFDCQRRAYRSRIFIYHSGIEKKAQDPNWIEIIPGAPAEALLKFACRDRK